MLSPKTGNPMREVMGGAATYTLRGQEFQVSGPAWECPDTGERYFTPEQGNVVLARLHQAWREQHGISQQALRQRGQALGLSDAQASALLGFGINQYRTYKSTDKLPSKSNARLLQMLCDDRALVALIEAAGSALTAATKRKLLAYAAHHQMAALATSANLTATVDITTIHDDFGQLATYSSEYLQSAGDYGYAMAA